MFDPRANSYPKKCNAMADAIAMADLDLGVATSDQLGGRERVDEFFRVTADRAVTIAAVVRDEPPAEGVRIVSLYPQPITEGGSPPASCGSLLCWGGAVLMSVDGRVWSSPRPYPSLYQSPSR